MRWATYQQTLAITLASVLFSIPLFTKAGPVTLALAQQLYAEGDWQHARKEALRAYHSHTNEPLAAAIVHLAALRLGPNQTKHTEALQLWLQDHPDHPQHSWVKQEKPGTPTPEPRRRFIGWLASKVIGFYQHQIGPGIGQRCAMYPSCSHYSLEACRRYGLAGIPMTADRIIRESDHIRYRINPIQLQGRELYYDPIEHHTHWFRRYRP